MGGRRTWSPEAAAPDTVVSEVARRHGLRPQQVFGWRRAARQDAQAAGRVRDDSIAFTSVSLDAPAPPAPPETPTIQVQIGDSVVRVPAGMDSATVKAVLRAVRATS